MGENEQTCYWGIWRIWYSDVGAVIGTGVMIQILGRFDCLILVVAMILLLLLILYGR